MVVTGKSVSVGVQQLFWITDESRRAALVSPHGEWKDYLVRVARAKGEPKPKNFSFKWHRLGTWLGDEYSQGYAYRLHLANLAAPTFEVTDWVVVGRAW